MSGHDDPTKVVIRDTVKETLDALQGPSKYSSEEPEAYRFVRQMFADQWDLTATDLTTRVNLLGQEYENEFGEWPRATQLFDWPVAQNSIWTFASGASGLDHRFSIIDSETGVAQPYINSPIRGLEPGTHPLVGKQFVAPDMERALLGPTYTLEQFQGLAAGMSPIRGRTGSGRAAREAMTFDRRELSEGATDRWRDMLLEEPEDAELDGLISDYISEANAFWVNEAGRLDFDTFVTDRIRNQARHSFLYSKKPEFQSEAEYMGGFRQTVSQFGLSSRGELKELETGASSGVGLACFGERVSRTRESRVINQGAFSQRLASTLAQSGLGGS